MPNEITENFHLFSMCIYGRMGTGAEYSWNIAYCKVWYDEVSTWLCALCMCLCFRGGWGGPHLRNTCFHESTLYTGYEVVTCLFVLSCYRLATSWRSVFSHDFWGSPLSDPTSHKSYRPLTILSFRFNSALHGLQPYGYHIVNLVLHGIVSVLFTAVCRLVASSSTAILAGLLFAVHPIHTEAVSLDCNCCLGSIVWPCGITFQY